MAQIRVMAGEKDYDGIMDMLVGSLVMLGYHIEVDGEYKDRQAGTMRAYIWIDDGGPQEYGKCGKVEVRKCPRSAMIYPTN